ncbi:MAG: histidine phosphatase family protein [Nanoarchaeota archaeon]|nr:histidine phosphatase family protein [Nanoarchaeota archaeon]
MLKHPNKYQTGKTIIYLVRHGERIHIPGTPPPHDFGLSKKGIKQAKDVAKKFVKIKEEVDALYTSPMKRAFETAVEIGKKINKKPIVIKGLEEITKILEKPKLFNKNYWGQRIKFRKKQKIFNELLKNNKGKVIILVAHGRLNRMLLGKKLGLSHKASNVFDSHNCHITIASFKGQKLDYIHCVNSKELINIQD